MSIFGRKSKSSNAQAANGKSNGQATPPGPNKSANASSLPNGGPIDPIVERMAIQAASRKRMNSSQTPDYSIKSASSGQSTPRSGSAIVSSSLPPWERQSSQSNGLAQPVSADSTAAPIEAISAPKPYRDSNKLRKSMSPQSTQAPTFTKRADPDTQKMRMPLVERSQGNMQMAKDSGYSSVAPSSTMDSRTQSELSAPQESELLRRHRQINASLQRSEEQPNGRALSLQAPTGSPRETKAHEIVAPADPTADAQQRSPSFISRLDPGSSSSSFLSSSVVPPKRARSESASKSSTPPNTARREPQSPQSRAESSASAGAANSQGRTIDASRISEGPFKPAPISSRLQEPPTRSVRAEKPTINTSTARRSSQTGQTRREQEQRLAQPAILQQSQMVTPSETPYMTPRESQSPFSGRSGTSTPPQLAPLIPPPQTFISDRMGSSHSSVASASQIVGETRAIETPPASYQPPAREPDSQRSLLTSSNVPLEAADPTSSADLGTSSYTTDPEKKLSTNGTPVAQFRSQSPQPQAEFPYLEGIGKGNPLPVLSILEGFRVNRQGHILDEEGAIIGELVEGEVIQCVRRRVDANGDVLDDAGKVVGKARPVEEGSATNLAKHERDNSITSFYYDSLQSPMSAVVGYERRQSAPSPYSQLTDSQQPNGTAQRVLTSSNAATNIVFELDASTESQPLPVVDQSDIFIPPFGQQNRSQSVSSLIDTQRNARRRQSKTGHTPTTSQEKMPFEERERSRSRRYISQSFDSRTGKEMPATNLNSEAAEQTARPRSYSMMAKEAPKAVLGPTWESLLETVPDATQPVPQRGSVTVTNGSTESLERAATFDQPERSRSANNSPTRAGGRVTGSAMGSRARRASQQNNTNSLSAKPSTHQTFVKSPLSSMANTPPEGSAGQTDDSFRRQLDASNMGGMQTSSSQPQIPEEDDDAAAPAPIVRKREATPNKSAGTKRKSFFGIPLGRSKQVAAAS